MIEEKSNKSSKKRIDIEHVPDCSPITNIREAVKGITMDKVHPSTTVFIRYSFGEQRIEVHQ